MGSLRKDKWKKLREKRGSVGGRKVGALEKQKALSILSVDGLFSALKGGGTGEVNREHNLRVWP